MKYRKAILIVMIALVTSACVESTRSVSTGKGTIRALNAAVTTPSIAFLLEERLIGSAVYKESTLFREFDDLTYNANFDYQFFGDLMASRLATVPFDLVKDTDYLFIYTGSLAAPDTLVWERPIRAWEGSETVFELWFGHLSPQLGEVDIYFAAPDTAPVMGEARTTLSNGSRSSIVDMPQGDYEIIVTSKDDPADIIFQSATLTYGSVINIMVSIFDPDPSITAPISMSR